MTEVGWNAREKRKSVFNTVARGTPSNSISTDDSDRKNIDLFAKPLGIKHPFSPVRIRKLIRSNNIIPSYLANNGYPYQYTLDDAFADWKKDCPEEWK